VEHSDSRALQEAVWLPWRDQDRQVHRASGGYAAAFLGGENILDYIVGDHATL
jgi:hypothetical protein